MVDQTLELPTTEMPEQVPTQDPPSKQLWQKLYDSKAYTNSYEDFEKRYSKQDDINILHQKLSDAKAYTNSKDDFYAKYFPDQKKSEAASTVSSFTPQNGSNAFSNEQFIKDQPTDAITLSNQASKLINQKSQVSIPGSGMTMGTSSTKEIPDEEAVKQGNSINADLKEKGFDVPQLNRMFGDVPEQWYNVPGLTKPELLQKLKDNPDNAERYLAAAKSQNFLLNEINTLQTNNPNMDFSGYISTVINSANDKNYSDKRKDNAALVQFTNRYVTDSAEREKILQNLSIDKSFSYGQQGAETPTDLANDPLSKTLNSDQLSAYHYIQDLHPEQVEGFNAAFLMPEDIKDNISATIGKEEKLKKLDEIGISLKTNYASEKLTTLNKSYQGFVDLSKERQLTDVEISQANNIKSEASKYQAVIQKGKDDREGLLGKYPNSGLLDAQTFAQELLGQKHTGLSHFALEAGKATDNTIMGVYNFIKEPFLSEQQSNANQAEVLGDSKLNAYSTHLNQDNQLMQSFTPTVKPELQAKVDEIKNNSLLNSSQKYQEVTKLLVDNPKQWQRFPIEGGKSNIGITSLMYGVGDLAANLAPFVVSEGGLVKAGVGKFTAMLTSAAATSFQESYAKAIEEGIENPYKHAAIETGVNAIAMAGADAPGAIRKLAGLQKSAIGDVISKLTDNEITTALRTDPNAFSMLKKAYNIGVKVKDTAIESTAAAAKITAFTTGGQVVNDTIDGNVKPIEDYAKQAAISALNFSIFGTLTGLAGKVNEKVNDINKAAIYTAGQDPKSFNEALDQKITNGTISQSDATQVRGNIEKAVEVFKKVPFVDGQGNPLSENNRRDLLFLKMQESDLETNISKDLPNDLQISMQKRLSDTQDSMDKIYKGTLIDTPTTPKKENEPTTEISKPVLPGATEPKEQGIKAEVQTGTSGTEQGNAEAATPVLAIKEEPLVQAITPKIEPIKVEEKSKPKDDLSTVTGEDARKSMAKDIESQISFNEKELVETQKQDIEKAKNDLFAINKKDSATIDSYVKKSGYKLITKEVIANNPNSELIKKSEGKYYISNGASIRVKTAEQIAIEVATKKANSKAIGSKVGDNKYVDTYNALTDLSKGKISTNDAKEIIEKAGLKVPKVVEYLLDKEQTTEPALPKQERVNNLIDKVNKYNNTNKNKRSERAVALNEIKTEVQDLGLTHNNNGGFITLGSENGSKIQKRNTGTNTSISETFDKANYEQPTHDIVSAALNNPDVLSFLHIQDANGRKMSESQIKKELKDYKEGKHTVGLEAIHDQVQNMVNEDRVTMRDVNGNVDLGNKMTPKEWVGSFKEPTELTPVEKELANSKIKGDLTKEIIDGNGLTKENLENNKHLFDGFPFEKEDYENVKQLLNGEGQSDSEPTGDEQQGTSDAENKTAGIPGKSVGATTEGTADTTGENKPGTTEESKLKLVTEESVKVLRLSHEDAIRELKNKEDKLAKEQAKQVSLFGDGPQKEMFANDPNEAKEILDPLKKKVKEAKEAFDNATQELQNQKDRKNPDLFQHDNPKSKSVDEIIDDNAQALIDFITPKNMKGVHTAGGSTESIIRAGAEIIKAAYHAKENIREAIEAAIDHIRDKFKEEGFPVNGEFIDKIRDTFIPQAEKLEKLTHLKKVMKMVDENLSDDQILMHLERKGVPRYNALSILGDAKENQVTPEEKASSLKEATEHYNKNVEDKWLGEKSLTLVESRVKAKDQQNEIKVSSKDTKTLKDKIKSESDPVEKKKLVNALESASDWRNIDKAIHIHLDLKRNPDHYNEFYENLTPKQKAIADLSNNLSPKQLEIADTISKEYDNLGNMSKEDGLIKETLDNYVARAWDFGKADATEASNKFSTSTKHSLQRSLDTILQGQAEGMKLKIEGATNNLQILKVELGNVIENRKLIEQGFSLKVDTKEVGEDGKPIMQTFFSTTAREGYAKIENPFFKKWAHIGKAGEDAEVFGSSNTKVINGNIFEKRDIYAPKDVATSLNNILGKSRLIGLPGIDKLTSFSRLVKQSILSLSAFHPIAFTRAHILSGKMTELKGVSPIKAYKNGLSQLHALTPEVKELLQGVLTIGRQQDWVEGIAGRGDGTNNVFSKMVNDFHKSLFENYGAGLKVFDGVNLYRHELIKNSKLSNPLSRAEIANKVGRIMNDTYGGENWQSMRGSRLQSPSVRHRLSLALLAPDWTISNLRLVRNAFKGDAQKMYRNMWFRVITRGVASTVAMNALMTLMDDKDENGNPLPYWDAFAGRYKKAWDAGHLRSLMVDMTPLYHAAGGDAEQRAYFSIFGAYTDPLKLVENPIDFLQAKLSPTTFKIPLEIATGQNWQHKSFTDIDELLGIDDKGKYTKTQVSHVKGEFSELTGKEYKKNIKGYNEGDEKGGKLKGSLVKNDYKPHGGLEVSQIPSFTLSQVRGMMPTAIQSIIQGATGENDWAKTLFTAPGTGVLFGKEGAVDDSKSTYNLGKKLVNYIKK